MNPVPCKAQDNNNMIALCTSTIRVDSILNVWTMFHLDCFFFFKLNTE